MDFGDLTKQLAKQAIPNPVRNVLDALRPADLSQISDALRTAKPAGPAQPENVCATMLGQVQAMQKALKDDDELVVLYQAAGETIRVLEIFVPVWSVVVLTGIDTDRNVTRVVLHADALQLVCKAMKTQPPAKPARVGFILPRSKPE